MTDTSYRYTLCSLWMAYSIRNGMATNLSISFDTVEADRKMDLGDAESALVNIRLDKFNHKRRSRELVALICLTPGEISDKDRNTLSDYYLSFTPEDVGSNLTWGKSKSYPRLPKNPSDLAIIYAEDEEEVTGILFP